MSSVNVARSKLARLLPLVVAAVCVMIQPRPSFAQPAPERPKAVDAHSKTAETSLKEAEAHRHFKQGREYLEVRAYSEAIAEFEAALSLMPLPELLFNIAQAHRLNGDAKRALETYKRYVEINPDGTIADEARAHIAALRKQIADTEQAAEALEAARRDYDATRDARTHQRRIGYVVLGVAGTLVPTGAVLGDMNNGTVQKIALGCDLLGLLGALPFGMIKVFYNRDTGPFQASSAKGIALAFGFWSPQEGCRRSPWSRKGDRRVSPGRLQ